MAAVEPPLTSVAEATLPPATVTDTSLVPVAPQAAPAEALEVVVSPGSGGKKKGRGGKDDNPTSDSPTGNGITPEVLQGANTELSLPVKSPLDLKHERLNGIISKYTPANGWGYVTSHMFEGELFFWAERIMPEFQGHPINEGEAVEFDVQPDDHNRAMATAMKPVLGRKPNDCLGQRHRGYVRRFAERWGFLNAAAFDGDLFVHRDNLLPVPEQLIDGQPHLRAGQAVEFDVALDDRGRAVAKQITTRALLRPCDWIGTRLRGYIRSFQGAWGFINSDRFAGDLFVHRDSLLAHCQSSTLAVGTVVEFDVERDHHRKGAKNRLVARHVGVMPGEALPPGHPAAPLPMDPAAYAASLAGTAPGQAMPGLSPYGGAMNPQAPTFSPGAPAPPMYYTQGVPPAPGVLPDPQQQLYGAPYPYPQQPYPVQPQLMQPPLPPQYGQPYPYGQPPYAPQPQPYAMPPPQPQQALGAPGAAGTAPTQPLATAGTPAAPLPGQMPVPMMQTAPSPYMPAGVAPAATDVAGLQQPPAPNMMVGQPVAPQVDGASLAGATGGSAVATAGADGQTQGLLHITMHDWEPDQPGQLFVRKGTVVTVSFRAAHGWVYAGTANPMNEAGEPTSEGWIPQAVVKRVSLCRVILDWPAEGTGTLGVSKGEIVAVSKEADRGWVYGERIGARQPDRPSDGWLPKKVLHYLQS